MGRIIRSYAEGDEITTLVKELTQEAINLFEGSAGNTGPSQFTDVHAAKEVLGTEGTVASGRMSLTFAIEMLRRHFGPEVFNHTGIVDLRFLRPVRPGDTITFIGKVTGIAREANGNRVFYTSLGGVGDFGLPAFQRLLLNGVLWALDEPVPPADPRVVAGK